MGVELLEIGVQMRRIVKFSIKGCYKIVLNHPFLVSMLCFIAFLYRSFPFLFSILVAASPVLVCTFVLLGTLLSFGQPNIPEIEREEKTTLDIVPLKTGVLYDTTHIESEDSYFVERYSEEERDVVEQAVDKISEVHRGQSFSDLSPLLEERSREFQSGDGVLEEAAREFYEQSNEKDEEKHDGGELLESQYSPVPRDDKESSEFDYDRSDSFDSKRVNINSLPGSPWKKEEAEGHEEKEDEHEALDYFDSIRINLNAPPGSPWRKEESEEDKEEEEEEEDEEDDDDDLDSESDRAESSSPDASMADIIPMLDELHPLLDEDSPQLVSLSHDGFDAASDSSGKSSESDNESDDRCVNQEELEVADDENEEEMRDKEDISKSAITWTEEDQKNLIDLGSSELERNQRLESLIARRRALKKMRLIMTEKNLIDFESTDLPFNIPPISTARNNPFDPPNDNYDLGLPPIPGSAPSILLQRRNPFDLPYDSSEEKPDLMEDSFQQEFTTSQAKDPLFRRHESFIVRPSVFGLNRQEKQDIHLRPYFVPERMASEGTSYSPFQRQFSELSDSKVSSVPETESLGSVEDLEDNNLIEEDARDKSLDEEALECKDVTDERISEEPELIFNIEHMSEHVRHGSQSSAEVESSEQLATLEVHHEVEETLLQEGRVANALEVHPIETQSKPETSYLRYSSQSSSSSLSSVSERIFADKEAEMWSSLEETRGHIEQNGMSRQASLDGSDFHITSTSVEQTSHGEPVYDSSPSVIRENFFSSSFSFTGRESVETSQDIEKSVPTNEEILATVYDQEFLREVACQNDLDVAKADISQDDVVFGSASAPPVHEFVVAQASIDSKSLADEDIGFTEETIEHAQQQISSSLFDADTHIVSQRAVDQTVESLSTSLQHHNTHQLEDEQHSLNAEEVPFVQPDMPSLEGQSAEDVTEKEEAILRELHDPSNAVENLVTDADSEMDENLISDGHHSEVCEEELAYSDKCIDEQPSGVHVVTEPPVILVEAIEDASITENLNASEIHDLDNGIPIINSPRTPDSISSQHGVDEAPVDAGLSGLRSNILGEVDNDSQFKVLENYVLPPEATDFHHDEQYIVEDADGIQDIDELLLSELDTVGDFSIEGSSQYEFEKRINSSGEGLSAYDTVDSEEACAERKFPLHPGNLDTSTLEETDEIEEKECASEIQESRMSVIDHIDASPEEVVEGEVLNAIDPRSVEGGLLNDGDIGPSDPRVDLDAQDIVLEMPLFEAHNSVFEGTELKSAQTGVTEVPQEVIVKEDTDAGMPLLEAQTIQDIDSAFWQVYEKEIEKSSILEQPNAELVTAESGMSVLEAQTVEDIELAFRQVSEKETDNSDVLELPKATLLTEQSRSCDNAEVLDVTSSGQEDSEMPVLEAQKIEDIESAFRQIWEKEIEDLNVLELPNAEVVTEESGSSDNAAVLEVTSSLQEVSSMPVLEAQTIADIELAFRQTEKEIENSSVLELPNAKLVTDKSGSVDKEAVLEVSSAVQEDSAMPVLEAQTVEDIELAFRQISEKEIENSSVLELPNAKLVTDESGSAGNEAVFEVSSSVQEDSALPVLEAQTVEDVELAFTQISDKEMENSNVLELPNAELVNEESVSSDDAAVLELSSLTHNEIQLPILETRSTELPNAELLNEESVSSGNSAMVEVSSLTHNEMQLPNLERTSTVYFDWDHEEIPERTAEAYTLHDSVGGNVYMRESGDIGASSDSRDVETDLALEQVLAENLEKPLNLSSEGESEEVKPSGAGSSKDMESGVRGFDVSETSEGATAKGDHDAVIKEVKALPAEKPDHAVDMPTTTDVEGKKDKPEKSGSSSSSSSDSSSSDSERE